MENKRFLNTGERQAPPYEDEAMDGQFPKGLLLSGYVVDRVRRFVPKDKPTTEIVTYTVDDEAGHKYYVDDYAPDGYFDLGECICVPVYVKAYIKKNKETSYTIGIQKSFSHGLGEHF